MGTVIKRFIKANYILLLILLVASLLRFYGMKWDSGFPSHPDERDLVIASSRINYFSNLNPKFFTYGGFPLYIISFLAQIVGWSGNLYRIHLISRLVSSLASILSVFFVYEIANKLFGRKAGIVASVLFTFSPGSIQYSHFGVSDSLAVFLMIVLLYLSLIFVEKYSYKVNLLMGLVFGLAVGTKLQAFIFGIIPLTSILISQQRKFSTKKLIKTIIVFIVSSVFGFFITNPYILYEKSLFLNEVSLASAIARGDRLVHFTLQFLGVNSFTFNIENILWLIGPVAIFGFLFFLDHFISIKKRFDKKLLVFALFPIAYFFYVNTWFAKFVRYMLPLTPFIIIAASGELIRIEKFYKSLGVVVLTLFLAVSIFYGTAFFSLYFSPMTTYTASDWIFANVPKDSKILTEALDLRLPLAIGGQDPSRYNVVELPMYEKDSSEKTERLVNNLVDADYLVFSSPRFWKNIPKDSKNYPISSKYYEAIFDGSLGYEKVFETNKYPSLLGIKIPDDKSEETFKVFDHPEVLIFKNIDNLSEEEMLHVINTEG